MRPNNFNNFFFLRVKQLYDLKKVELTIFYKVELTMLQIDHVDYNNTHVFSQKNIVVQLICNACKTNWAICNQGFEFSHFFYPLRILVKKQRIKRSFILVKACPLCWEWFHANDIVVAPICIVVTILFILSPSKFNMLINGILSCTNPSS